MIEIELDGKKVEVAEGSMVMHAAEQAGVYIPHFCYHKKLSIAANCRMCLVDVEKAPKPMPACATPVTQGMIVRTKSDKAIKAQQSVMEFLLINHPLDCPICDQGGECQLQDLAVGYGGSASRYQEEKRVVFHKNVGPLISMEEMSRCIHCTRCVRFGQEVAGIMELGMVHRGEHSEITTVSGSTVDSELSGNMIDICPVGALTSKPFRYSARTWELSRRKSISPHDSTGANLIVQVKGQKVMRVVPFENEEVNECWIADRDRFSYEALSSDDRLLSPMIKQGGKWQTVDWTTVLEYVANGLKQIKQNHGPQSIGALAAPHSTVEELHLLAELVRGLGSHNIDHRLRHTDFSNVGDASTARWLGRSIASLSSLQSALVVGSFLRKDHPLFAQRLRQAARRGAQIHRLGSLADDWLMPMGQSLILSPSRWVSGLAQIATAVAQIKGLVSPIQSESSSEARAIAHSLLSGHDQKAVLLGNSAAQHPQASLLLALATWISEHTQASVGYLTESSNSVGAQWVDALPRGAGMNTEEMLQGSLKAMLLLNLEPALDFPHPAKAMKALAASDMVVALTSFKSACADVADVLIPIAPFTETSGTLVNAEGRIQSFYGVVKPLGDARPAWKVLRVLGNLLGLSQFSFENSEQVLDAALGQVSNCAARLSNRLALQPPLKSEPLDWGPLERITDVFIYGTDSIVRRAPSLHLTADACPEFVSVSTQVFSSMGFTEGALVKVIQEGESVTLPAFCDPSLAPEAVRIPAGRPATAGLVSMFGPVRLEKI